MRILLAILLTIGMTMTSPASVADHPLHPVDDLMCNLQLGPPCTVWWSETPGVAGAEHAPVAKLSADGQTMYTVATILDGTTSGGGCYVYATETLTGLHRWSTVIPHETGCGIAFDIELEPVTGDLLIAGLDWRGTDVAGVHRLNQATGTILWHFTQPDLVVSALAIDPSEGILYATGWVEEEWERPKAFIQTIDPVIGTGAERLPAMPDDEDVFWVLDIARDAATDQVFIGGSAGPSPDDPWEQAVLASTLHAMNSSGTTLWTARDPTPGHSFGGRMAYPSGTERVFMATQNGLLTIETRTGTVLDLAPLADGTQHDDIIMSYGVAYDAGQDLAVMTGARISEFAGGAYAMVAARGQDGGSLWDSDLVFNANAGNIGVAHPVFDEDGRPWFTGAVITTLGYQAVVGTVDPASGEVLQSFYVEQQPGDQSGAYHIGTIDPGSAVISGVVARDDGEATFEALIRFNSGPLDI